MKDQCYRYKEDCTADEEPLHKDWHVYHYTYDASENEKSTIYGTVFCFVYFSDFGDLDFTQLEPISHLTGKEIVS
jgi:hypothetical protein